MKENVGNDSIAVGVKLPSGQYERPVPRNRLFWTLPGKNVNKNFIN